MKAILGWFFLCCLARLLNPSWWAITNAARAKGLDRSKVANRAAQIKINHIKSKALFDDAAVQHGFEEGFEAGISRQHALKSHFAFFANAFDLILQGMLGARGKGLFVRFIFAAIWLVFAKLASFLLAPIMFIFSARNYSGLKRQLESYPYEEDKK